MISITTNSLGTSSLSARIYALHIQLGSEVYNAKVNKI